MKEITAYYFQIDISGIMKIMQVVDKTLHQRRKQWFLSWLKVKFDCKTVNITPDSSDLKAVVLATFNSEPFSIFTFTLALAGAFKLNTISFLLIHKKLTI